MRAKTLVGFLCVAVVAIVAVVTVVAVAAVVRPSPAQLQPARPGVKAVQGPLSAWKPIATFDLGGDHDWLAISDDAVWITNDKSVRHLGGSPL